MTDLQLIPPWIYGAVAFAALTAVLGIMGVMEGRRSFKGLKPPVDSGK